MAVAMSDAALELAEALHAHRAALAELDAGRRALAEAARRHTRERSTRAKRVVRHAQAAVDAAARRVVEIGREVGRLSASQCSLDRPSTAHRSFPVGPPR
jgi:hypothetical protein